MEQLWIPDLSERLCTSQTVNMKADDAQFGSSAFVSSMSGPLMSYVGCGPALHSCQRHPGGSSEKSCSAWTVLSAEPISADDFLSLTRLIRLWFLSPALHLIKGHSTSRAMLLYRMPVLSNNKLTVTILAQGLGVFLHRKIKTITVQISTIFWLIVCRYSIEAVTCLGKVVWFLMQVSGWNIAKK